MKALLINPWTKKVTPIIIDDKLSLERCQSLLGGYVEKVPWDYDQDDKPLHFTHKNDLLVHEEGLFQGFTHGFTIKGIWPQPILGMGLIIGVDIKKGKWIDVDESLFESPNRVEGLMNWSTVQSPVFKNYLEQFA